MGKRGAALQEDVYPRGDLSSETPAGRTAATVILNTRLLDVSVFFFFFIYFF